MSSPTTMKALVVCQWPKLTRCINLCTFRSPGQGIATVKDVPVPVPADNQIVVEVKAVALNPTDWKHIDFLSPAGSLIGCDYAGVVKQVSKKSPTKWKIGDRVAGAIHGGLYPDRGSFSEYLIVDDDMAMKIPPEMSYVEASTYGVSVLTAMQALNLNLGVPWLDEPAAKPDEHGNSPTIFVYAGSTTAGLACLQLAKIGGYQAVTTCSPHSFDLVKSYGAHAAFDYNSPFVMEDIQKAYPKISVAVDCFAEGQSTKRCCQAVAATGGKVVTLLPAGSSKTPGVEIKLIMAYTLMGEPFQWFPPFGPKWPAVPEDRAAAARFVTIAPDFVGKVVKAPPIQEVGNGWDGLLQGLDMLRQKKVSGKKLVVTLKTT